MHESVGAISATAAARPPTGSLSPSRRWRDGSTPEFRRGVLRKQKTHLRASCSSPLRAPGLPVFGGRRGNRDRGAMGTAVFADVWPHERLDKRTLPGDHPTAVEVASTGRTWWTEAGVVYHVQLDSHRSVGLRPQKERGGSRRSGKGGANHPPPTAQCLLGKASAHSLPNHHREGTRIGNCGENRDPRSGLISNAAAIFGGGSL